MKKVKIFCVLTLLFALSIVSVYGTSHSYTKILPRFQGHITLTSGTKSFGTDTHPNASNRVTKMGGDYNAMYAWVDSSTRITDDCACYVEQGAFTIPYNVDVVKGTRLKARAKNEAFTYVDVSASGIFSFDVK